MESKASGSVPVCKRMSAIDVLFARYRRGRRLGLLEKGMSPAELALADVTRSIWSESTIAIDLSAVYRVLDSVDFESFMVAMQLLWSSRGSECSCSACQFWIDDNPLKTT